MTDFQKESQQREEFKQILFDLAKNQGQFDDPTVISDFCRRLDDLYSPADGSDGFRHFYSDIFDVLSQIQRENSSVDIEVLGQNLSKIRESYRPTSTKADGSPRNAENSIKKLYDHVNLDIARLLYIEAGDYRVSGDEAIADITARIDQLDENVTIAKGDVSSLQETVKSTQKEYIAILGIFAAILLAFVGGMTFSTSVLENIDKVDAYRIILISLVIGLILVNALFALFYFIVSITKDRKTLNLRPMIISDVIFLLLMVLVIIAWKCGYIERRDADILGTVSSSNIVEAIATPAPTQMNSAMPNQ